MNLTEYKFKKGKHFSRPLINPILHPSINKVSAYVMFTYKSIYTCADQMDWNKLMGISWGFPFNKNAIMWAYRWNTDINSFQLSPYINANGEQFYLDGNIEPFKAELNIPYHIHTHISCANNKTFIWFWIKEWQQGKIYTSFMECYESKINTNSLLVTRRRPYHGGNTTPYNDYSVYMGYV
jgi:hypothetical protein